MRSDKGYSFDITNAENVPLVYFLYLRDHRLCQAGANPCRQRQVD